MNAKTEKARAADELDAANKDTERLNWMNGQRFTLDSGESFFRLNGYVKNETIREAIDAQMALKPNQTHDQTPPNKDF